MVASSRFYTLLATLPLVAGPLFYRRVFCDHAEFTNKDADFFYETGTGMYIPKKLTLQDQQYALLSAAARKVTFLRFSVYALGIYILDRGNPATFDTCSNAVSGQSLVLRLAPYRATTGAHMSAGLERALLQQLQLLKDPTEMIHGRSSIEALKASIPRGDIQPGDVIIFAKDPQHPSVLSVYFKDAKPVRISSPWLCNALFESYLCSPASVVQKLKNEFAATFRDTTSSNTWIP